MGRLRKFAAQTSQDVVEGYMGAGDSPDEIVGLRMAGERRCSKCTEALVASAVSRKEDERHGLFANGDDAREGDRGQQQKTKFCRGHRPLSQPTRT